MLDTRALALGLKEVSAPAGTAAVGRMAAIRLRATPSTALKSPPT